MDRSPNAVTRLPFTAASPEAVKIMTDNECIIE